jgi:hypothetical protein
LTTEKQNPGPENWNTPFQKTVTLPFQKTGTLNEATVPENWNIVLHLTVPENWNISS